MTKYLAGPTGTFQCPFCMTASMLRIVYVATIGAAFAEDAWHHCTTHSDVGQGTRYGQCHYAPMSKAFPTPLPNPGPPCRHGCPESDPTVWMAINRNIAGSCGKICAKFGQGLTIANGRSFANLFPASFGTHRHSSKVGFSSPCTFTR